MKLRVPIHYSVRTFAAPQFCRQSQSKAFTLIELLLVIGLIAIIAGLVVPAVSSMMMGSKVSTSANHFVGTLDVARQTAIARNHTIEVRLYKYADPEIPGESVGKIESWKYRGYQLIEYLENGGAIQFSKMERLPVGIIFDAGSISSLLRDTRAKAFSEKDPQIALPRIEANYSCASFRFLPSGTTDLGLPAEEWYVTIHRDVDGDNKSQPPANYATVQVDSISGSVKLHRPGL